MRAAAYAGAQLVLVQELFDGDYFCIEQHTKFLNLAYPLDTHPTVLRFTALAKELGIVLPISVFERAGQVHYNTTVIVDADGKQLGHYRKSHIPDGRGYQEKFYFSPGDTGFKVWNTAIGTIGLGDKQNRSRDVLGRVYEYFLTRFASAEGKNGGQFYTPSCVVRCLVEMLAPYKGRIYDPACGSGGHVCAKRKVC